MEGDLTVSEARELALRRLAAAGVPSPAAEAVALLEDATGLDRATLLLRPERALSRPERLRLLEALRRRAAREPLQHVLGVAPFYGLELAVDPDVLVPRPETERLVELVLEALRDRPAPRVLDVGTGSGAVALAVRSERPAGVVWAWAGPPEAGAGARRTGPRLGLEVTWVLSDLLADAAVAAFAATADALVANLPYLPASDAAELEPEVHADPERALFSGADGLDHARRLIAQARRVLPFGALLALELDPRNVRSAERLLVGWRDVRVGCDLAGRERFVVARR